jgi:hypothetical protein
MDAWVADGRLKGAARKLNLSVRTVEAHVGRAAQENGLPNTGRLLVLYVRDGAEVKPYSRAENMRAARAAKAARRPSLRRFDDTILSLAERMCGVTSVGVAQYTGTTIDIANKCMQVLMREGALIRDTTFRPFVYYKAKRNGNQS